MTKKVLSAKDLLAKKKIIESKIEPLYFSEIFGGDILISQEIPTDEITEIMGEKISEYEQYVKLIYLCCPIFKAPDFREIYTDIKEPYDIVKNVFARTGTEIFQLGNKILAVYGFIGADIVEKTKK